jgi:hypothetical protein
MYESEGKQEHAKTEFNTAIDVQGDPNKERQAAQRG